MVKAVRKANRYLTKYKKCVHAYVCVTEMIMSLLLVAWPYIEMTNFMSIWQD